MEVVTVRTEARADAPVEEETEGLMPVPVDALDAVDSPAPELPLTPGIDELGDG
jgi:hypothetical protein